MRWAVAWSLVLWSAAADQQTSIYELFEWVKSEGGFVDGRQTVREFMPGVRGIFATRDIEKGALLAEVPKHLMIAGDGCEIVDATKRELDLGDRSRLAPYISHLGGHISAIPNFWSERVFSAVANLPPFDWRRHTEWYERSCPSSAPLTAANTRRALELFVSRACGSEEHGSLLVPVYDLYNHRNGDWTNSQTMNSENFYMIRTTRHVSKGDQLFSTYGDGTMGIVRDYAFVEAEPQFWDFSQSLTPPLSFVVDEGFLHSWVGKRPTLSEFMDATAAVRSELGSVLNLGADLTPEEEQHLRIADSYRAALRRALELAAEDLGFTAAPHTDEL